MKGRIVMSKVTWMTNERDQRIQELENQIAQKYGVIFTAQEAANALHMSRGRLYVMVRGNQISFRRHNGAKSNITFTPRDLAEYLEKMRYPVRA